MRRYSFYVFLTTLTFGIISFIAFKFCWKVATNSPILDKTEVSTQNIIIRPWDRPWKFADKQIQNKEMSTKPFCSDERVLPIWKELMKDKDFKVWSERSDESFDCKDMVDVKEINLNQDNQKEILLRGKNFNLCSAVGNCGFWIYEKKNKKYRKLLYSTDYVDVSEMGDQIEKSKTKGYFDILLKGHMSASDTSYEYFKFDGKKYKTSKSLVHACTVCVGDNPKWEFMTWKEYENHSH